jgi:hypothetical protein
VIVTDASARNPAYCLNESVARTVDVPTGVALALHVERSGNCSATERVSAGFSLHAASAMHASAVEILVR